MNDGPDRAAVRAFFETDEYLSENPLIAIRARLVAELLAEVRGGRILDLGCGDGAISRPLLASGNHLTLVDFSDAMLERARAGTPAGAPVDFVACDVADYVPDVEYDAVLCVGVLAHLPAAEPAVARIAQAVKPGGLCVLQITDSRSPLGWALTRYHRLRSGSSPYSLNIMSRSEISAAAGRHDLVFRNLRRYGLLLPGTGYLPAKQRRRLENRFAPPKRPSRAGAEILMSFERRRSAPTVSQPSAGHRSRRTHNS